MISMTKTVSDSTPEDLTDEESAGTRQILESIIGTASGWRASGAAGGAPYDGVRGEAAPTAGL